MLIRSFRFTDLEALIKIAQISFAEEYKAQGLTPETFEKQIRQITRGRMIPFRLLSWLSGEQFEIFVAEVDGKIVGTAAYLGKKNNITLANLMVHPDYRRQGIGQALLEKRLAVLREKGIKRVTTSILASNIASINNVKKQGFEEFDNYSIFETVLPLAQSQEYVASSLVFRPLKESDKQQFTETETKLYEKQAAVRGSYWSRYQQSRIDRLLAPLFGSTTWFRVVEQAGQTQGFIAVSTSKNQTKGMIGRPIIKNQNILLAAVREAANWLYVQGKNCVQLVVNEHNILVAKELLDNDWQKIQTWKLFKKEINL